MAFVARFPLGPPLASFGRGGPKACAVLLAAACCVGSVWAQTGNSPQIPRAPTPAEKVGDAGNGRFAMTPLADGFLRLDTRSGQVSLCKLEAGQAQCRASADERAALEAEIDRLNRENAALKAAQDPKTAQDPKPASDDEERRFDRAMDRAERFLRRMMRIFRDSTGEKRPAEPL
jgi:hypothetical protein